MRMRLTADAPIRIGGREQQVSKLEYAALGGVLHVISPRKLGELLLSDSERTLDDWNGEVLQRGQDASLTAFLRRRDLLSREHIESASLYSVPTGHDRLNQFQPNARDGHARLFVPGTAIKGAIRAAVTWALVDKKRANAYVPEQLQKAADKNRKPSSQWFGRDLDMQKLQSYPLPDRKTRSGPHHDLMRAVKVSDAYGELESAVEKITIQSYQERGGQRRASLSRGGTVYVECLKPGSYVEFDLKVDDKNVLRHFRRKTPDLPFSDERTLLALVRSFYGEVWEFEQRYYGAGIVAQPAEGAREEPEQPEVFPELEDWIEREKGIPKGTLSKNQQKMQYRSEYNTAKRDYEAGDHQEEDQNAVESPPSIQDSREMNVSPVRDYYAGACPGFRLGWGSGLMSTTVDLDLEPENLGTVLRLISRTHHTGEPKDGPKSRKLVESVEEDPRLPMGWARLEEVRDD